MGLSVKSACRTGQVVEISYGILTTTTVLDATGGAEVVLDLFQGIGKSVTVTFADRARRIVAVKSKDLDRVSKIAIVWTAPINLDLHVFEYDATFSSNGHVWSTAPSSFTEARIKSGIDGRGHGFMSSRDNGDAGQSHVQVYTFVRPAAGAPALQSFAVDYATRGAMPSGETCGSGRFAAIEYQLVMLGPDGQSSTGSGVLKAADCNVALSDDRRYQKTSLSQNAR